MDEETIIFASKSYMRHLVAQTNVNVPISIAEFGTFT